ncbi:MAG TPA: hypothetical protein PKX15_07050 [Bacteroidales bacterium]|nr:hypothetical protein [Bacteroidales bacterium]
MSDKINNIIDSGLKHQLGSLYHYLSKKLNIRKIPRLKVVNDKKNHDNPFGYTAYYKNNTITLYITGRHSTDILRSFAHEVIHHWQNERGTLRDSNSNDPGYAQSDEWLRRREMEAYLFGNLLFRDWQDENRNGPPKNIPFLPQPLD